MKAVLVLLAAAALAQEPDTVTLPNSGEDLARGKRLYLGSCTYCHGPTGDGGKGADLSRRELVRAKTDGDLARVIEVGVPGTEMPGAWHMTRREVTQVAAYVRTLAKVDVQAVAGDAARGKAIYARQGCAACHTIKEGDRYVGGFAGPDLSSIGLKRNAAHLRESVVDPAASVNESFRPARVVTRTGFAVEGRLVNEDTFALVVRDLSGNNHAFLKQNLRSWDTNRAGSPMPAYKDKLSRAEADDLVAYMVSLKEPLL